MSDEGNLASMTSLNPLLLHLQNHVLIADGAMGTMIQNSDVSIDDFNGLEGCNEILNATRSDVIEGIHLAYFAAGSDAVETNSFGSNYANFLEYGIQDQIFELSLKSSQIARKAADQFSEQKFVLGSMGPGTKLPSLNHIDFETLRAAYTENAHGLIEGGADALLVETAQDPLQAKAAIIGAQSALEISNSSLPIFASITVEQTGTMLLGTETSAALGSLINLGIDSIGLNCATGPQEMSEHLRLLSSMSNTYISCMPNAGLPLLVDGEAVYPLEPDPFADYLHKFVVDYGISIIGGCCGTTPEHIAKLKSHVVEPVMRRPREVIDTVSSLYQAVPLNQDITYLNVGERANANGSKKFREALLSENFDECTEIAINQTRSGAHVIDLCVDYVGRNGVVDMREIASRLATASSLPIMLDSTEPEVIKTGLEHFGGRCIINSVNFEDGAGPESRFQRILKLAVQHGAAVVALTIDEEGQARTAEWKIRVAERLIESLVGAGINESSILVDCLTFPIATGQEETRRDGLETLKAIAELKKRHPKVKTILGLSNISFGLNPAARQALNSVFLSEAVKHGLDAAIVDSAKILPLNKIAEEKQDIILDLIYDNRKFDQDGNCIYDPLTATLNAFENSSAIGGSKSSLDSIKGKEIEERLRLRIIDGISKELESDLLIALEKYSALEIVNNHLLPAMKEVGDLFGSGVMQLPFVLQSAEVMKLSVGYLEQFMEKSSESGKGKVLLATVKGDVHDIGKNLVDIILTNNGYTVVNIGIKQTIQQIVDAAEASKVDIIGMSGLLVKSTVIMKENLEELNLRKLSAKYPVILGGAALTRTYVEDDLANVYEGVVRYAKDAFEGLSLVDNLMKQKNGESFELTPLKKRIHKKSEPDSEIVSLTRSNISLDNPVPQPPFLGDRVVKGISLAEIAKWLDHRALFVGQWGLKPARDGSVALDELIENEGMPRLRFWLDLIQREGLNQFAVVYGYFPAVSEGNTIYVMDSDYRESIHSFTFPRQTTGEKLCLADYVKTKASNEKDFVAFHVITMGNAISEYTNLLFQQNRYRDYLELHGLSVQLTEALAEMWHSRIRSELGISQADGRDLASILKQEYQGERYSFGYPACPDLEMQGPLVNLLKPDRIGVALSDEFQLHPEQSTSAIIFHHPEARYFNAR